VLSYFELLGSIEFQLISALYGAGIDLDEDDDDLLEIEDRKKDFEELVEIMRQRDQMRSIAKFRAIETLINSGEDFDVNEKDSETKSSILLEISETNRLDLIKFLVEKGADVNEQNDGYWYPLLCAASEGRKNIYDYLFPLTKSEFRPKAEELLKEGLLGRMRKDNPAYWLATAFTWSASIGNIKAISAAISQGIDVNTNIVGHTALFAAIDGDQLPVVRMLLEAGADPQIKGEGDWNQPAIFLALARASDEIIQELLTSGIDINEFCDEMLTPLMVAIMSRDIETIQMLLEHGADVNLQDGDGHTALYFVNIREEGLGCFGNVTEECEQIIQLLFDTGATAKINGNTWEEEI